MRTASKHFHAILDLFRGCRRRMEFQVRADGVPNESSKDAAICTTLIRLFWNFIDGSQALLGSLPHLRRQLELTGRILLLLIAPNYLLDANATTMHINLISIAANWAHCWINIFQL